MYLDRNVVHVVRQTLGVTIDEWDFSPMSLQRGALFTVVKATRTSGSGAVDVFRSERRPRRAADVGRDDRRVGLFSDVAPARRALHGREGYADERLGRRRCI